jgi:hypothetical protein
MRRAPIFAVAAALLVASVSVPGTPRAQRRGPKPTVSKMQRQRDAGAPARPPGASAAARFPKPPQKGGERARDLVCGLVLDNRTGYFVEVTVDDEAVSTIPPWSNLQIFAIAGDTRLAARTRLPDGSIGTWGPISVLCPRNGWYTWRLAE